MAEACPSWNYGILGFAMPTVIPCGGEKGHDGPHRYSMTWTEDEPHERFVGGRWYPSPVPYTTPDKTCTECAERATANSGAWPCHRCDHSYHMGPCPSEALT